MPALGLFLAEGDKEEEGEWRFRPGQLKKRMKMMMQWNSVSMSKVVSYCQNVKYETGYFL